jgi:hypothetical protein
MAGSRGTEAAETAVISRRDAIVGALALAAGTLIATRPDVARAADGEPILAGRTMDCASTTWISCKPGGTPSSDVYCEALMTSSAGPGFSGFYGRAAAIAGPGAGGVFGEGLAAGQCGVWAINGAVDGIGLKAQAPNGTALRVEGPATFSRSGLGTITRKHSTATVTVPTGLAEEALILVTLQGSAGTGVYLRYAKRVTSTKFQVVLSKAATAKVYFAWMILN